MFRTLAVLVGSLVSFNALSAHAQEAVLNQLYGAGVHSYFAYDFTKSHEQLSQAISAGSRDPRVYYFRGLAFLKLGRPEEAVQDFQKGAELETKDLNRSFNVARSLERVQGSARQQLETYRASARLAALAEADKIRQTRFEAIKREEDRVLRNQAAQGDGETIATPDGQPNANALNTDPFGNPQEPKNEIKAEVGIPVEPKENTGESEAFGSGDNTEKPVAGKKPATGKKGILGALFKGAESSIKKSAGSMLPKEMGPMGPGAMKAPGSMMPPQPGMVPPGDNPGNNPFGNEGEETMPPPENPTPNAKGNPFQEEPAAEKPAKSSDDPFEK